MALRLTHKPSGRPKPAKRSGSKAGRFIRSTVIGMATLLLLIVGGGVAYTWYEGTYSPPAAAVPLPVSHTANAIIKPVQPQPDAPVGVSVQSITSPIAPGSNASVTIRTNAGAKCTISVMYNNVASKDSGLVPKTADEYGMVTWAWTVGPSVPLGKWPVKASCANAKNSGVVDQDLVVTNSAAADATAAN